MNKKKLVSLTITLICIAFFVISCKKTDKVSQSDQNNALLRQEECIPEKASFDSISGMNFNEQCEFVALKHNEGLDQIFTYIVNNSIKPDDPGFEDTLRFLMKSFCENRTVEFNEDLYKCQSIEPIDYNAEYIAEMTNEWSETAVEILDSVYTLVNDNTMTDTEYNTAMNDLYDEAKELESDAERISLCLAMKVAIRSKEYWTNNGENWAAYFAPEERFAAKEIHRVMLVSDITGATTGAIGGFFSFGPVGAFAFGLMNGCWQSAVRGIVKYTTGI